MISQLAAGNTLGRYELLIPVAKGGMAQVWAARLRGSRGFQKLVAIKTILSGALDNTRLEQMFLAEAQLASQIHHPNVVGTLELGEHEGMLYLVMEWVDGEPVSQVMTLALQQGGLPLPVAVSLIAQACQGLHAAHELRDDSGNLLGVVHRDVSPQNLLVMPNGTAKLVDFGVAKATARAGNLTEVGEVKGKFSYMAPEQVQAQSVDRRADIFALGILAYLLTTGKHPFRGASPGETVKNIMSEKGPVAPSALIPDYPVALEAVILQALQKSPDRRFKTAEEMFVALEAALPEALEASFQQEVAAYLGKLLGPRANQRRAAIRQAQDVADRHRTETGQSSSTLRAISLDSIPDGVTPSQPQSAPLLAASGSMSAQYPIAAVPSSKRYVAAVLVALSVAVAAVALRSGPPGGAAAASGAAQGAPLASSLSPAPAPHSPAPQPPVAVTSEAPPLVPTDLAPEKAKKSKGRSHVAAKQTTAPASPPAAVAPSVAVTPTAAPPKATASSNAWDRNAFGGRH
jgi:serine/threonine-protein kinase